uniref:Hamartin n=1 Tax=Acrobeloides nanus TaxID=290746 RepID=A0A914BY14_9BILA
MELIKQIKLLESLDMQVQEDAKLALSNRIAEGIGIGILVQYYAKSQSVRALELLCLVREPHDRTLLDKMNECMAGNPSGTLVLLGRIIQKAPSWLPKFPQHLIFNRILDLIKPDKDIEIAIGAIICITSLLPHCSSVDHDIIQNIFNAFIDACEVYYLKRRLLDQRLEEKEEFQLRMRSQALRIAISRFFKIFYAIYPCNLIYFLRRQSQNLSPELFHLIIEPLLLSVRFHPDLLLENREKEFSKERWTSRETHDFFAMTQKISTNAHHADLQEFQENFYVDDDADSLLSDSLENINMETLNSAHPENEAAIHWTPSMHHGLETPPESYVPERFTRLQMADSRPQITSTLLPTSSTAPQNAKKSFIGKKFETIWKTVGPKMEDAHRASDTTGDSAFHSETNLESVVEVIAPSSEDVSEDRRGSVETAEECDELEDEQQPQQKHDTENNSEENKPPTQDVDRVVWRNEPTVHEDRLRGSWLTNQGSDIFDLERNSSRSTLQANRIERSRSLTQIDNLEDSKAYVNSVPSTPQTHSPGIGEKPMDSDIYPFSSIVMDQLKKQEQTLLAKLSRKTEQSRRGYMKASEEHHSCLKELGLADRLPGRIYDDMEHILNKLSADKQRVVLQTRLRLVNQHLMFERYARLLHAHRNRRLFAKLKQQKSQLAETEKLKKAVHQVELELEKQIKENADLRNTIQSLKNAHSEMEEHFLKQLKQVSEEKENTNEELEKISLNYKKASESQKVLQQKFDAAMRKCDDLEAENEFIKRQLNEVDQLKNELSEIHKRNQHIKDQLSHAQSVAQHIDGDKARNAMNQVEESSISRYEAQLKAQRAQLRKSKNEAKIVMERAQQMETHWKEEAQRRNELKALLERASTLHAQQTEAAQHKFNSLLSICGKQEAHIFSLHRIIEQNHSNRTQVRNSYGEPMAIPSGSIPPEMISYESSFGGSEIPSQLLLSELFGKRETVGHSPPRNNSLSFGLEPHFSPKPRRIKEISRGDISSSIEEHSMSPESPHMD